MPLARAGLSFPGPDRLLPRSSGVPVGVLQGSLDDVLRFDRTRARARVHARDRDRGRGRLTTAVGAAAAVASDREAADAAD